MLTPPQSDLAGEASIRDLYERAKAVRESEMTPMEKLCAYPFADDDQVVHRSELGTITVGDLRAILPPSRPTTNEGESNASL